MKTRGVMVLLMLCAGLPLLRAQAEPAAATNAAPTAVDLALRDPFTSPFAAPKLALNTTVPTPTPMVSTAVQPQAVPAPPDHSAELRAALKVQGFVKQGDRQFAMVGGRLVGVGEVIKVCVGAAVYRFRVSSIQGAAVKFEPLP